VLFLLYFCHLLRHARRERDGHGVGGPHIRECDVFLPIHTHQYSGCRKVVNFLAEASSGGVVIALSDAFCYFAVLKVSCSIVPRNA
jgi:hypothetical protein